MKTAAGDCPAGEAAGSDDLGIRHEYAGAEEDGHGACACGWTSRELPGDPWPDVRFAVWAHVAWICELDFKMDVREVWPTAAVALGDQLRERGRRRDGGQLVINSSVLPPELRTALDGVEVANPDTAWPHWGTVLGTVDWASLVALYPDVVAVSTDDLASNRGARWEAITAACDVPRSAGLPAAVQGLLEVDTAARVTLLPIAIATRRGTVPADVAHQVVEILVEGGRGREELGDRPDEWFVSC